MDSQAIFFAALAHVPMVVFAYLFLVKTDVSIEITKDGNES
jgi:hypothetical protein